MIEKESSHNPDDDWDDAPYKDSGREQRKRVSQEIAANSRNLTDDEKRQERINQTARATMKRLNEIEPVVEKKKSKKPEEPGLF
jgi:hypothetical protein